MIILVGIGLTWMLYNIFYTFIETNRTLKDVFDRKPFNCHLCLSVWVGLIFFFSTALYPALLIPICYEIVRQLMRRL